MLDGLGVEQGMELAVGLDEEVLGAAGDPEEAEVGVDGLGVFEALGDGAWGRGRGAEGADPVELVVVVEGDGEGVVTAHGEARERAGCRLLDDAILGFDEGDDVVDEIVTEGGGVLGGVLLEAEGAGGDGVGVWHDDDHGLGAAGGDEGVEDPVGLSMDGP